MFIRRSRYYILKLAKDQAATMARWLNESEVRNVLNNSMYISNNEMSDEE